MSSSSAENLKEAPILEEAQNNKLPSFENWVDSRLRKREEYPILRQNVFFFACMATIGFHVTTIRAICSEYGGLLKQDSKDFEENQKIWWYHYRKLMLLRSMIIRYYDLPCPNWGSEIISEREYMGVLLSEEDYVRFLTKEGSGMELKEPDSIDKYEVDKKDPLKKLYEEEQKQEDAEEPYLEYTN